jgi:hypothetical protein
MSRNGRLHANYTNAIDVCFLLSITNKIQGYRIFFITVNALHVSGGFSAHHQEFKTVHTASGIHKEYCITLHLVGYT